MSTKTTFKRVALVAVAALGLGVLSVAPSSAAVINLSATTVTTVNGTATTAVSDSTTAATVQVKFTASGSQSDSATITSYVSSAPASSTFSGRLVVLLSDTATSTVNPLIAYNATATAVGALSSTSNVRNDSTTVVAANGTNAATYAATFKTFFATTTGLVAGTYVVTNIVTPFSAGVAGTPFSKDVSIVVSATAAQSKVANSGTSTAVLQSGSTFTAASSQDSAVALVATASTADVAVIGVDLKNANGDSNANESITATITGPGLIGSTSAGYGKSVVMQHTAGAGFVVGIRADGNAGVATITLSTPSVTFAPKSVTFYAKSPKTITAANYAQVLNVGQNANTAAAVVATAVDANGTNWAGQLYIKAVAAADALVGGSATDPIACSYVAADKVHLCPITTLTAGTAKFVVVDETLDTDGVYTAADSAATSNEVTVTVSSATPAAVKLSFDKATYAPFEKATITVTPVDAAGKTLGTKQIANLFATGGITSNVAFGSASDTLTAVTLTTAAANSATTVAGAYTYTVYMPAQGDVTISATGGTGLAAAGQVKVTATASIVNSSVDAATDAANEATDAANAATDAALAAADAADAATAAAQDASDAVAALSASVSKLISSLRAQITSLTNLVIKIQKKVRA